MKIAIVYTTVGGATRECAQLLAKQLERHDVTVADMDISLCILPLQRDLRNNLLQSAVVTKTERTDQMNLQCVSLKYMMN